MRRGQEIASLYIHIYIFCVFVSEEGFLSHLVLSNTNTIFKQIYLTYRWDPNRYYHSM